MNNGREAFQVIFDRSAQLLLAFAFAFAAFGEGQDTLVKYNFSGRLNALIDLDQVSESHLVATDAQGYLESHVVRLSRKDGTVVVEADFMSREGLTKAIAWLVSRSGEEWNVVGTFEAEKSAPTLETPPETATPMTPTLSPELSDCTAGAYDAFILAHEIETMKSSLATLAVEDPLQGALQAREAELSELLRGIAENEGPKSVEGEEISGQVSKEQGRDAGGLVSEVPLGSQKKELEQLKQDRQALEDELAAWGVM